MARKIYRSAVDGSFVTEEFAKANPDTTVTEIVADAKEHNLGLTVAREVSEYHIGDRGWADMIVEAYLNPESEGRALAERMKRDEAGL